MTDLRELRDETAAAILNRAKSSPDPYAVKALGEAFAAIMSITVRRSDSA